MAYKKATEYTCLYEGMRGVDFSAEDGTGKRFSELVNLFRDYDGEGGGTSLESIPGFRRVRTLPAAVHAIYRQRTNGGVYAVVHAGKYLYRFPIDERDDTEGSVLRLSSLRDGPSSAVAVGEQLYVLDGECLRVVHKNGDMGPVDDSGYDPYVPTLYDSGVACEQRNLLTDRFRETFTVTVAEELAYGTPGLCYEAAADGEDTVTVTGMGEGTDTALYIPSRVTLGGRRMRVVGVSDGAFEGNAQITSVTVAQGVERIGARAFKDCTALREAVLHDSVSSIGEWGFAGCSALADVYLGHSAATVGADCFAEVSASCRLHYAGTAEELSAVSGHEYFIPPDRCFYGVRRRDIRLQIPLCSPALRLTGLFLDGEVLSMTQHTVNGRVAYLCTDLPDRTVLYGKTFTVEGRLSRSLCMEEGDMVSFLASYPSYEGTAPSVIHGCTVCAVFDGRVFVSGHPALPGLVFYTQRTRSGVLDPSYFGVFNYFVDGVGASPVVGMLATADALAVFKREDDGAGGIFYHKPQATDLPLVPRVYPVAYVHNGLGSYGACLSFLDDPVFVGPSGIQALNRVELSLERSIAIRSHAINARLLREQLSEVRLCRWLGYLVVSVGGRMYLADSRSTYRHRTGHTEYEWYFLDGVGTYTLDTELYRYASVAESPLAVSERADEAVEDGIQIREYTLPSGETVPYVLGEDGTAYAVTPTEERRGGVFHPARAVAAFDELLLFGTEDGSVCVFNNDLRGVPPKRLAEAEDFDAAAYAATYGRRLHPEWYGFDHHAPRYLMRTVADNVGIPHLEKRTVPHSMTVKFHSGAVRRLQVSVYTDRDGDVAVSTLPSAAVSFADMDFGALSFEVADSVTLPMRERCRGWVEKQITLCSDEYCSPIGISNVAYRYTVDGRIRHK